MCALTWSPAKLVKHRLLLEEKITFTGYLLYSQPSDGILFIGILLFSL